VTELAVWLYGTKVGTLSSARADHLRFDTTIDALERWGEGATVLSVAVPFSNETRPPADRLRAFFNGLLPEGAARDTLARRHNLRPRDVIGLLRELGEDCAGAVMALPVGVQPAERPSSYKILTPDDLHQLILDLPSNPLGLGTLPVTRKSLAGVQPKLLLTRLPDGAWAYSTDGAPSTHILKPEEPEYPGGAANEAWCMRLARACGLTTVHAEVLNIAGLDVFCVERYDRVVGPAGIERLHQEDACQALGIETFDSHAKYGSHNPKRMTLRAIADLLRAYAPAERTRLLAATVFNVVICNADAHGKNHSIIHHVDGSIQLAPLYDTWSTIQYPRLSQTLSLAVGRTFQLDAMSIDRLAQEGTSWGLAPQVVQATIQETIAHLTQAIDNEPLRHGLNLTDEFTASLALRARNLGHGT
jgi:serine/threonine-protein kinase HipA